MKKLILLLLTCVVIACSSGISDVEELRYLAKKHTIEKLNLPEGTQFNPESLTVQELDEENEENENTSIIYSVKVTVRSQDKSGKEINKTHILIYKKSPAQQLGKEQFELISFD